MNEIIAGFTEFEYIGPGYLIGVPARDLTAADLVEVRERERITRKVIVESGLYKQVDVVEVEPFCGAPTVDGGRCQRPVERWGDHCYQHQEQHQEVSDGTESVS